MPSKEVITFWLDTGAPISLLSRSCASVLVEGRTPVKGAEVALLELD